MGLRDAGLVAAATGIVTVLQPADFNVALIDATFVRQPLYDAAFATYIVSKCW